MRRAVLAAAGLSVLLVSPASASTGPFTGTVRENQTRTHSYDNNPQNLACIQVMATYTVTLTYTPTTDVLSLTAGGVTATGSNGVAVLSFERSWCTAFQIRVTGTSVERTAAYTVTVRRGGEVVAL